MGVDHPITTGSAGAGAKPEEVVAVISGGADYPGCIFEAGVRQATCGGFLSKDCVLRVGLQIGGEVPRVSFEIRVEDVGDVAGPIAVYRWIDCAHEQSFKRRGGQMALIDCSVPGNIKVADKGHVLGVATRSIISRQ